MLGIVFAIRDQKCTHIDIKSCMEFQLEEIFIQAGVFCYHIPGIPKEVHTFKIVYLCPENRQITKLCLICQTKPQLKFLKPSFSKSDKN